MLKRSLKSLSAFEQLALLLVVAGSFLVPLLPLGLFSLNSGLYLSSWGLHLLFQFLAIVFFLRRFFSLVRESKKFGVLTALVSVVLIFGVLLLCSLPVTARDALLYHLAVPKLWLRSGSINEIPWHEWSYFPLILSNSYSALLYLGLEQFAAFYHFSYAFLAAALLSLFVYEQFSSARLSLLSFVFLLSIPLSMKLAAQPMADFGAALFFGLGALLLLRYLETERRILLLLGSLSLGLCLCTKYSAILAILILAALLVGYSVVQGRGGRRIATDSATVFLLALLLFAPWLIKNALWTGNPVYPFLGSIFGGNEGLPFFSGLSPLEHRLHGYGESFLEFLLIPFRTLFFGRDADPRYFAGVFSPFLLLSLFVLARGERKHRLLCGLLGFLVLLYWYSSLFLFYALVRYQLIILIPLVLLSVAGLDSLGKRLSEKGRGILLTLTLLGLSAHSAWYFHTHAEAQGVMEYLGSEQSAEEYLNSRLSEYETIRYVNTELPRDSRVYLMFTGNRFYYYEPEVQGAYFSAEILQRFFAQPRVSGLGVEEGAAALAAHFRSAGISHLAIHNRRTQQVLSSLLGEKERGVWGLFLRHHAEQLVQQRFVSVWKIAAEEKGACGELEKAIQKASELTGLGSKRAIQCERLGKREFTEKFKTEGFSQSTSEEDLEIEELVMKSIGFIPPNFPYARCVVQTTAEDVLAFYSVLEKKIFIPAWKDTSYSTMVHEAVHVLQDQHYDLEKLREESNVGTDRALAFTALVEGEAIVLTRDLEQSAPRTTEAKPVTKTKCSLPLVLSYQYDFPYDSGARYVARIIERDGIEGLRKKFSEIPSATSTVLYDATRSERYVVSSPRSFSEEDEESDAARYSDTLGEYTIRAMLRSSLGSRRATLAALGWQGDYLAYYPSTEKGQDSLSWQTTWRSEKDAKEFAKALEEHFSKLHKDSPEFYPEPQNGEIVQKGEEVSFRRTF